MEKYNMQWLIEKNDVQGKVGLSQTRPIPRGRDDAWPAVCREKTLEIMKTKVVKKVYIIIYSVPWHQSGGDGTQHSQAWAKPAL